jgi:hypothetical protein
MTTQIIIFLLFPTLFFILILILHMVSVYGRKPTTGVAFFTPTLPYASFRTFLDEYTYQKVSQATCRTMQYLDLEIDQTLQNAEERWQSIGRENQQLNCCWQCKAARHHHHSCLS